MGTTHFCFLDVELERRLAEKLARRFGQRCAADLAPALPVLIDLVASDHEQPVEQRDAAIRELVVEHADLDEAADSVSRDADRLERCIGLLKAELEQARQQQLEQGEWSDTPVPPLMFG